MENHLHTDGEDLTSLQVIYEQEQALSPTLHPSPAAVLSSSCIPPNEVVPSGTQSSNDLISNSLSLLHNQISSSQSQTTISVSLSHLPASTLTQREQQQQHAIESGVVGSSDTGSRLHRKRRKRRSIIQKIENNIHRHTIFNGRKNGLIRKALELSVLCDCNVGLMIFTSPSDRNMLYTYSSYNDNMNEFIEKYNDYSVEDVYTNDNLKDLDELKPGCIPKKRSRKRKLSLKK